VPCEPICKAHAASLVAAALVCCRRGRDDRRGDAIGQPAGEFSVILCQACRSFFRRAAMTHTFETDEQRVSYGIGRQMGDQLLSSHIPDLSVELGLAGLRDACTQQTGPEGDAAMQAAFQTLQAKM